jgi:hypothetical protein
MEEGGSASIASDMATQDLNAMHQQLVQPVPGHTQPGTAQIRRIPPGGSA